MATPPCDWTIDTGCCADWAGYSADLKAKATAYATLVLWAATGRRFGLCETVVRPCGRTVTGAWAGNFWGGEGGILAPYILDGVWYNCACGGGCVACEPSCQVLLPGPVAAVTEVVVGDEVIDEEAYRVDDGKWLVRIDGECWPDTVDLDVSSGDGFFEVTYDMGVAVPTALAQAAGTLACEYAKGCLGQDCQLPQRVSSIIRQGVQITMPDVDFLLERGLTGVQSIDHVIVALNPRGLSHRPRLYTPDLPQPRVTTS